MTANAHTQRPCEAVARPSTSSRRRPGRHLPILRSWAPIHQADTQCTGTPAALPTAPAHAATIA